MATEKEKQQIQFEKKIQCLVQQIQGYSNQVEAFQGEMDHLRGRLSCATRDVDDLRRQLGQKDDAVCMFESKMENLRFEFQESDKANQRISESLQTKLANCQDILQQREAALSSCRSEIKSRQTQLDEARNDFLCELQHKENTLIHTKEDMRRVYDELKCKTDNTNLMEKTTADLKTRVHTTCAHVKEAENRIKCLLDKIQEMECLNSKEKNLLAKDNEEYEKKLNQSCSDLCACVNENRKLKRCLQDEDERVHQLMAEVTAVTRDIQLVRVEICNGRDLTSSLENNNKETCRLLQQKTKCVKELETELCVKNQELQQCRCCVEQLEETVNKLRDMAEDVKEDNSDVEAQLKACREKIKKTEQQLEQSKKKLEYAVLEMENMATEIKRLNCELDETRRQIAEKISKHEDLQQTLDHLEIDLENRARRCDDLLQRYEKEIKEKANQINDCEEKCLRYQKSLGEKDVELEEVDHKLCRATCDINGLCSKVKEMEETRDMLQKKNNDQRAQYSELSQNVKCTKEQLDCLSMECGDAKRELSSCQRELDKVRRDREELQLDLQEKDATLCRLADEKSCFANKVSNLQCRLETETSQLTQQLSEIRHRMESEIDQLRTCQMEADEVNTNLTKKLSAVQRQQAQLEKCYYQKVDTINRENQTLMTKIADKDDQLQAVKDTVTLKDSEIMRLKLRLCSGDRCSNNMAAECSGLQACSVTPTCCRKRSMSWGTEI